MVAHAVDELRLGPVTLVANDSGGAIAQILVAAQPDPVERLVLTTCDAYEDFPPRMFRALRVAMRLPGSAAMTASAMRRPLLRQLPVAYGWVSMHRLDRDVEDSFALPMATDRLILDDASRVLLGMDSRHTLAAARRFGDFAKPVLVAWSRQDRFFAAGNAERLARDFPDARLVWIDNARTFSPEDQPDTLAQLIADFAA
jgi:pimeloyl-ACP methyl ester carboxylesterase